MWGSRVAAVVVAGCAFRAGVTGNSASGDASVFDDGARGTPDAARDADVDAPRTPLDCLDAFQHGVTTDGAIMIAPGGGPPFTAYCDMTTAGGGWTLVYVYGFTDYATFDANDNAVDPRPTWPFSSTGSVSTSTVVPPDPMTTGALDYSRWPTLGSSFMVASSIDQWYACTAGTSSIVDSGQNGSISCTVAKVLTATCTTDVPTSINWYSTGPWLQGDAQVTYPIFYFWDGSTDQASWPTHDPCGVNGTNQLTGISNPVGAIYLRRS